MPSPPSRACPDRTLATASPPWWGSHPCVTATSTAWLWLGPCWPKALCVSGRWDEPLVMSQKPHLAVLTKLSSVTRRATPSRPQTIDSIQLDGECRGAYGSPICEEMFASAVHFSTFALSEYPICQL